MIRNAAISTGLPLPTDPLKVLVDGKIVDADQAVVSVFDHGFLYGDGVYETVRLYEGRAFHWADHVRRFRASARHIGLNCPWTNAALRRMTERLGSFNRIPDGTIRITLARGRGALGLSPDLCSRSSLVIAAHPTRDLRAAQERGVKLCIAQTPRVTSSAVPLTVKSISALPLIQAKREAARQGAFEAVMLNEDGYLTEGTASNLFWVRDGILFTPHPSVGLFPGITRKIVLGLARKASIPIREGRFRQSSLSGADEIFLTNSGIEIMPVMKLKAKKERAGGSFGKRGSADGPRWPITLRLQTLFRMYISSRSFQ